MAKYPKILSQRNLSCFPRVSNKIDASEDWFLDTEKRYQSMQRLYGGKTAIEAEIYIDYVSNMNGVDFQNANDFTITLTSSSVESGHRINKYVCSGSVNVMTEEQRQAYGIATVAGLTTFVSIAYSSNIPEATGRRVGWIDSIDANFDDTATVRTLSESGIQSTVLGLTGPGTATNGKTIWRADIVDKDENILCTYIWDFTEIIDQAGDVHRSANVSVPVQAIDMGLGLVEMPGNNVTSNLLSSCDKKSTYSITGHLQTMTPEETQKLTYDPNTVRNFFVSIIELTMPDGVTFDVNTMPNKVTGTMPAGMQDVDKTLKNSDRITGNQYMWLFNGKTDTITITYTASDNIERTVIIKNETTHNVETKQFTKEISGQVIGMEESKYVTEVQVQCETGWPFNAEYSITPGENCVGGKVMQIIGNGAIAVVHLYSNSDNVTIKATFNWTGTSDYQQQQPATKARSHIIQATNLQQLLRSLR